MNLNNLEKLARQAVQGNNVTANSHEMLSRGFITPAEHRSLSSLSSQIAANVRANSGTATMAAPKRGENELWV